MGVLKPNKEKKLENYSMQQLIKKCKKGDSRAQFQLFQQYARPMYNVAYRITGSSFDAEDAVQEAFIKAFRKIDSFKEESTFGAWLKRIVVNQCISELRRNKFHYEPIPEHMADAMGMEDELILEDTYPMEKVRNAIERLPKGARVVFTLKAIESYKFSEISAMLNLSESNCKVQYHRSKKLLNKMLKGIEEDE